jgi:hypothetical protein
VCDAAAGAFGLPHPTADSVIATTAHTHIPVAVARLIIVAKISAIVESS